MKLMTPCSRTYSAENHSQTYFLQSDPVALNRKYWAHREPPRPDRSHSLTWTVIQAKIAWKTARAKAVKSMIYSWVTTYFKRLQSKTSMRVKAPSNQPMKYWSSGVPSNKKEKRKLQVRARTSWSASEFKAPRPRWGTTIAPPARPATRAVAKWSSESTWKK